MKFQKLENWTTLIYTYIYIYTPTCIYRRRCFPMATFLMKPFPNRNQNDQQRIFSYRLSRSRQRRVIENTFGIIAHCFALLRNINFHNILIKQASNTYQPPWSVDQEHVDNGTVEVGSWNFKKRICPQQENSKRNHNVFHEPERGTGCVAAEYGRTTMCITKLFFIHERGICY